MGTQWPRKDGAYYASRPCFTWGQSSNPAAGWVYAAQEYDAPLVKIGITEQARITTRIQQIECTERTTIILIGAVHVSCFATKIEHYVHWLLKEYRILGEWFYLHLSYSDLFELVTIAVHASHAWAASLGKPRPMLDEKQYELCARCKRRDTGQALCACGRPVGNGH